MKVTKCSIQIFIGLRELLTEILQHAHTHNKKKHKLKLSICLSVCLSLFSNFSKNTRWAFLLKIKDVALWWRKNNQSTTSFWSRTLNLVNIMDELKRSYSDFFAQVVEYSGAALFLFNSVFSEREISKSPGRDDSESEVSAYCKCQRPTKP